MKPTVSKKDAARKRVTVVLAVVCCLSILVGTLAFFTDRVNQTTTSLAGTLDLVFNDISASRSGTNGILSPNEFAIDGVWGRTLVQENSIINPGDYFDLSYNLSNVGSKSMDVKHRLTLESTVPLTGNEYTLNVQGVGTIPGTLSADGLKLIYDLPEFILNGTGTGAETEAGISGSSRDFIIRLDLNAEVGNALQGAGVTVTLDSQAKQHRNTDDNVWVDWAEYKIGVEQTGDNYNPELVPMLAPNKTWFTKNTSGLSSSSITEVEIVDTYTPTGEEYATWDASDSSVPGTVTAYAFKDASSSGKYKLTVAGNGYGCVYANPDSSSMFASWKALKKVNFDSFNTSKATTMESLFDYCNALTSVNVGNFDTSNVTNMKYMFYECYNLTALDLANWDTGKVKYFNSMFAGTDNAANMKFKTLDVESWDMSSATSIPSMFYGCGQLTELDLSNWDVSNVTNMNHLFADCRNLKEISFTGWDTKSLTNLDCIFNDCDSLVTIDVSDFDTGKVTKFSQVFESMDSLTSIIGLDKWDTSSGKIFTEMFQGAVKLQSVDLSNFNTQNATEFYSMFASCLSLETIDVSTFNTSKVARFYQMFYDCINLKNIIGIEDFDMGGLKFDDNVGDIGSMFAGCHSLTSLDLSKWDVSNVVYPESMFKNCRSLRELNISTWNTPHLKSCSQMFSGCSELRELALSSLNTASVISMGDMFMGCAKLTTIYVSNNWSTASLDMNVDARRANIFRDCTSLIGGAGTAYTNNHVDYGTNTESVIVDVQYAHIDEGTSNPGYLTYKAAN